MVFASRLLQTAALPLITTTPLRAYALALTAHLVDTARAAAKAHLAHTLAHEVCPPELEDLSVGAYHRLIAYRAKCSAALRTKCKWPEATGAPSVLRMSELGEWTWFACRACVKHRGSDWSCRKLYCGCAAPWFQTFWDGLLMALCMTPHQDTLDKLESRLLYRLYEGAGGCSTCKAVVVEQIGMLMIVLKQAVDAVVSEVILSVL
ncbi:hypothetical protein DICSQDRAFT_134091 [Dichomitus squalens LYAD-421 SS1]|uniref:uncharacterized protein n=1 Tax=Dichomitus squalens (strain LYAD-421) TaxID=732165 RepID=UPI0004415D49|nr:uncharacterized protein DICSQDRAFT_134091 [Dichomitus squalens LYAD-421 SS1]EJF64440.1 hypothetical protein DICSQDRAFT_134091 [Dichomitus squalens LYAD-421 SS1]